MSPYLMMNGQSLKNKLDNLFVFDLVSSGKYHLVLKFENEFMKENLVQSISDD